MSCTQCPGKDNAPGLDRYPCPCDRFVFPSPLNIGAGLDRVPRQTGTFPEFRRAMLRDLRNTNILTEVTPLSGWRAREKDDYGIMLLEMWAYVCDCLSFYDEVLANEAYLRTSALKPDLRRLVALLGYLPRPAVGSVVDLAALADGRLLVQLPAGTAFRSGAFDGNPPQVFELDQDTFIHPFTNRFGIVPPHNGTVQEDNQDTFLLDLKGEIKEDTLLLLVNRTDPSQNSCLQVKKLEKFTGIDNRQYNRITFTGHSTLKKGELLENLRLMKPGTESIAIGSISGTKITLNAVNQQVRPGELIILVSPKVKKCFTVVEVNEVTSPVSAANTVTVNKNVFKLEGFGRAVTELTLNDHFAIANPGEITVYFGMQTIAAIIDEPNPTLSSADNLLFNAQVETPVENYRPSRFLMHDKNTLGTGIGGSVNFEKQALIANGTESWNQPLTFPVTAYGNVITASRGEKVENEKMGSGNASVAGQSFKLKKKPLTYHLSPTTDNDQGVKSSLTVYVDGIKWSEVNNFYGKGEYDQVYIVRQNDQCESVVTFGDGIRGQRLPSGIDNVICNYRFGAEAACPPSGSVNQISKPVKGLQSVNNILPAYGGADAEEAETMRTFAPKSALILGRIVSIKDMEAVAASFPGVRAVQAEWRWDRVKQRATAHLYYIGSDSLKAPLSQRIRNLSDPSTPITVETAGALPLSIVLSVSINPRFLEKDVIRALFSSLLDPGSGLLAPENIGIGKPLYRSRVFDSVLNVDGTEAVHEIVVNSIFFNTFALAPGAGNFFDIEQGGVVINGKRNG